MEISRSGVERSRGPRACTTDLHSEQWAIEQLINGSLTAFRAMGNRITNKWFSFFSLRLKIPHRMCSCSVFSAWEFLFYQLLYYMSHRSYTYNGRSSLSWNLLACPCLPLSHCTFCLNYLIISINISEPNFSRYSILRLYMVRKLLKCLFLRIFLRNIKEIEMRTSFEGFQ